MVNNAIVFIFHLAALASLMRPILAITSLYPLHYFGRSQDGYHGSMRVCEQYSNEEDPTRSELYLGHSACLPLGLAVCNRCRKSKRISKYRQKLPRDRVGHWRLCGVLGEDGVVSLLVSCVALLVSFAALYFNKLQPGRAMGGISYARIWRFSSLPDHTETDFKLRPDLDPSTVPGSLAAKVRRRLSKKPDLRWDGVIRELVQKARQRQK